ncbi:ectoine/hydroxyectoine ABC transporter permease subunit EhuD [Rhizobium tropici]|uniref:Ectoine/hydroxyectoine ABC transporter permease subunit EhuD n=1 Tax=Rhizobium tropici TaxID=398 RepID=A0A5B0W8D2_RHITR|nr:ectoine/hydroxyectoine ABC transporter permease subunit EhuD [Rhizobium tropici]KAA1183077.1 ectoine/hydroxyectoine ABC transporter permease subunit EhuD [Rhizobium tropici]
MIQGYEVDTSSTTAFALSVLPILLIGLRTTILAMFVGFVIALIVGLAFALLRRSMLALVSWPAIAVIEFLKNTPLLMQLFFLYFVLPQYGIVLPAFWTGCVALGLQYAAYMSEVYRAGLEAIPKGQWEAATALNVSKVRAYGVVVIPQMVPRITPAIGNYLVSMMKDTPILSTITVVEMLNLANRIGDRTFEYLVPLSVVGLIFLALTSFCSAVLRGIERIIPTKGIPLQ